MATGRPPRRYLSRLFMYVLLARGCRCHLLRSPKRDRFVPLACTVSQRCQRVTAAAARKSGQRNGDNYRSDTCCRADLLTTVPSVLAQLWLA